jgi:hypothetical protein
VRRERSGSLCDSKRYEAAVGRCAAAIAGCSSHTRSLDGVGRFAPLDTPTAEEVFSRELGPILTERLVEDDAIRLRKLSG